MLTSVAVPSAHAVLMKEGAKILPPLLPRATSSSATVAMGADPGPAAPSPGSEGVSPASAHTGVGGASPGPEAPPPPQQLGTSSGNSDGLSGRERKLVVLGIPFDSGEPSLLLHFAKWGDVEDAVVMRCRSTGRSRGFGFVTFVDAASAAAAAAAPSHTIDGRRADVRVAVPKAPGGGGAAPAITTAPSPLPPAGRHAAHPGRLFVARIPPSVSEPSFRAYWERYGPVVDAYLPTKDAGGGGGGGGGGEEQLQPDTPPPPPHRGIGFVTFADPATAAAALAVSPHTLGGAEVAVDVATPKEQRERGHGHHHLPPPPGSLAFAPRDRAGGLAGLAAAGAASAGWPAGAAAHHPYHHHHHHPAPPGHPAALGGTAAAMSADTTPGGGHPAGPRVFVGRVPPSVTEADLRAHFGRFGFVLDLYLAPARPGPPGSGPPGGGHRGFGFVTFETVSALARLAAAGPHVIKGVTLAIDAAVPRGGESGGGSGMAGVGGGGGGTGGVEDGATSGLRYPPPPGRGDFFPGPAHGEARPRVAYRPY